MEKIIALLVLFAILISCEKEEDVKTVYYPKNSLRWEIHSNLDGFNYLWSGYPEIFKCSNSSIFCFYDSKMSGDLVHILVDHKDSGYFFIQLFSWNDIIKTDIFIGNKQSGTFGSVYYILP